MKIMDEMELMVFIGWWFCGLVVWVLYKKKLGVLGWCIVLVIIGW